MTDGLIVVDKPSGWTSHQVVGRLRRLLKTRKVGHAGTLDPMATGVLVIGVGKGTRLLGHLALHDKRYVATIRLGAATITDDAEGEVLATADVSGLTHEQIEAAMVPLRGDILQRPSSVSAIKVDGQRSYARVRAGEAVELKARPVTVSFFEIMQVRLVDGFCDVDVAVECSSGTYIRALARDLGEALGVGGHLTMLRRERVGGFTLAGALTPQALADDETVVAVTALGEAAKAAFPWVVAPDDLLPRIRVGQTVPVSVSADPTAMLSESGELLGLYRPAADNPEFAKPIAVLG